MVLYKKELAFPLGCGIFQFLPRMNSWASLKGQLVMLPEALNRLVNRQIIEFVGERARRTGTGETGPYAEGGYDYLLKNRNAEPGKVTADDWVGKKGECMTRFFLTEKMGYPRNVDVDFIVYPFFDKVTNKWIRKSWRPDLPFQETSKYPNIHVKTCGHKTRGIISWTFQLNDRSLDGNHDMDLVSFVHIEEGKHRDPTGIITITSLGEARKLFGNGGNGILGKHPDKGYVYCEDLKGLSPTISQQTNEEHV